MSADAVVKTGSCVAMGFGVMGAIAEPSPAAIVAMATAVGGLITAVGGQFIPPFLRWLENLHQERIEKIRRHDFANKLNVAHLEIADLRLDLKEAREDLKQAMEMLWNRVQENTRAICDAKDQVHALADTALKTTPKDE